MNLEVWEVRMSASQGPADNDVSGERRHLHSAWGKGVGGEGSVKGGLVRDLDHVDEPTMRAKGGLGQT